MKICFKALVVILALMGVWACGPLKLPTVSNYALMSTQVFASPRHAKTSQTLYIEHPIANPGYQTTDMIYMTTPLKLSAFTENQWVAPPAYMLQSIVAQAVRAEGYFKAVLTTPSASKMTYRLELQLICLQQEFLTATSQVRLCVQATFVDNANGRVLASQRFDAVVPSFARTPYAGALAANQAATTVAERIARFCLSHANQN